MMGSLVPSLPDAAHGVVPSVKTLVVTDLVDSTRLLSTVGDRRGAEISAHHERLARDLIVECGGREIDKTDGFLLLFDRTADAVRYSLAYHRALGELSSEEGVELTARVGVHLGEVFLRSNPPEDVARGAKPVELEGFAKMIAARVMALAKSRQTLITRAAFDLARQAAAHEKLADGPLRWLAHGPYLLKGIAEPVEVFEVGVSGFAPLMVPQSTAKAKRAVSAADEITLGWRPAPGLEVPRRAHWILIERLGEGGFGEVWLAHHEKTGEARVFKFCYQPDRLRSLQREVTLFRLLKETLGTRDDIARILEWNFERAPYFLECEYTEGGNLLEWVAEQGGAEAVPLADRLELLAQVADALAAAHSVGVLHKDVKPANVLITTDTQGHPKVRLTDFGIGLITDRDLLSRQGITVFDLTEMVADSAYSAGGTHLYMAPELVEGRTATVQADVYALGVMLYQFVVGDFTRALAPGWRRDLEDDILREDVAEMVDGRPERRLRDLQEVAERLRTLDARRARREAEERARREREEERRALDRAHRRRRIALVVASAAVIVLAVVSYLAIQAVQARREAERRRAQAEDLIGFMVGDLRKKLEPTGHLDILDDVGDHALKYFAAVPESDLTDEEVYRRSQALYQIGDVRASGGNLPSAMTAYRESLALVERVLRDEPDNAEWQKGLGTSHFGIGYVLWRQGDLRGALEQFRAYLEVAERNAAAHPGRPDLTLEIAYARSNIGSVLQAMEDLDGAQQEFERSLDLRRALVAKAPDDADLQLGLATAHNKLGALLESRGDLDQALAHYREELRIKKALVDRDPANTGWQQLLATSHNFMGVFLEAKGDEQGALEHFREAESIAAGLVALDSTNSRWRWDLAVHRVRLGRALETLGQLQAGLAKLRSAVATMETLAAKDPTDARWRADLARGRIQLAVALIAVGKPDEAHENLADAREALAKLIEERPKDLRAQRLLSLDHTELGRLFQSEGRGEEARQAWRRAVEIIEPAARTTNDKRLLDAWARPLIYLGLKDEAEPALAHLDRLHYGSLDFALLRRSHGFSPSPGSARRSRSNASGGGPSTRGEETHDEP